MYIQNEMIAEMSKQIKLRIIGTGYAKVDSTWGNAVKYAPCSKLYYILSGSFYMISDDGDETILEPGKVYLVPSGYTYRYGCHDMVEHVYYHFQLSSYDKIDILRNCPHPLAISVDDSYKLRQKSLVLGEGMTSAIRIQGDIYQTLCMFVDQYNLSFEHPNYSDGICKAIKYISENLSIQLDIKTISKATHLAPSTLSRKFRREVGMSIGEYIDSLIMFSAEQKVIAGNETICEISESYGFCDQFYFSRKFKEKYGLSPREYRKTPFY